MLFSSSRAPSKRVQPVRNPQPMLELDTSNAFVIPDGVRFEGILELEGDLIVTQPFRGDITARRVTVASEGSVNGIIVADRIEIFGRMNGDLYGDHVAIGSGAHVEGEIHFSTFAIEPDAWFEGKTRRHDSGRAAAPPLVDITEGGPAGVASYVKAATGKEPFPTKAAANDGEPTG